MKTTIEISEPLLNQARRLATRQGTTLRALVEEGLRKVVAEKRRPEGFHLRRASFRGEGLQPEAAGNGWALFGLRYPTRPVEAEGVSVLPVIAIEACSPKYSGPILKDDRTRFLSLLMPCKISVYKKSDGKVYIGTCEDGSHKATVLLNISEKRPRVSAD